MLGASDCQLVFFPDEHLDLGTFGQRFQRGVSRARFVVSGQNTAEADDITQLSPADRQVCLA